MRRRFFEYLINSIEGDGWKCIKYGVENHVAELKSSLRKDYSDTAIVIKSMPDFVVLNDVEKKCMFVEVKYMNFVDTMTRGELLFPFKKGQISKYKSFWNTAKLLIMHQREPYFFIVDLADVDETKMKRNTIFGDAENWNFKTIQKGIKTIFPKLTDETIEIAVLQIKKIK